MPDAAPSPAGMRSGVGVGGYVSLPSLTRASRAQIDLFVNRRYVEDRALTHAVVQAYHTLLPGGRYPLAVLFVELEAAEVDVNVHPRKTEVRFADARGGLFGCSTGGAAGGRRGRGRAGPPVTSGQFAGVCGRRPVRLGRAAPNDSRRGARPPAGYADRSAAPTARPKRTRLSDLRGAQPEGGGTAAS